MQSKGAIKLLAVLLALACVYQLSFTFKTRSVEKKASEYAAQFPLDQQGEADHLHPAYMGFWDLMEPVNQL